MVPFRPLPYLREAQGLDGDDRVVDVAPVAGGVVTRRLPDVQAGRALQRSIGSCGPRAPAPSAPVAQSLLTAPHSSESDRVPTSSLRSYGSFSGPVASMSFPAARSESNVGA